VYEAVMTAYHHKLDNLVAILDYNKLQFSGSVQSVLDPGDMAKRWRGFNWNVLEIDGHDIPQIIGAFDTARKTGGVPTVIIANTVKGKGVPFMEGDYLWHSNMDNQMLKDHCDKIKEELGHEDVFYAQRLW
jgi:transketolase